MPLVEVSVAVGRPPEALRALIHKVTEAVSTSLGTPAENVRVIVREVPSELWAAGDVTLAERSSRAAEGHGGWS